MKPYGGKLVENVVQGMAFDIMQRTTVKGTYLGNPKSVRRKSLKGKTAIIRTADHGFVLAQFDDTSTGLGYGWHRFPADHFNPILMP